MVGVDMLSRLKALQNSVKVAIVGIGSMGKGLFHQSQITPGIQCIAMADIKVDKAVACAESLGARYRLVHNLRDLHETIRQGLVAICEDGDLLARCEPVDVLLESTNSIGDAGRFAITALHHHKHLVMMNAEADLIFGPYLLRVAQDKGAIYTSCDGDQPGVIRHLMDGLQLWGFEVVMAGNIKGYLDRYSNPTTIIPEADKRNLDYKMCTSYTDGTKLNIEMALLANALGLSTHVPGMHGPQARHVREVFEVFDLGELWSEGRRPVVDYILGAEPKGGVFAIGYCDNEYQRSMLAWFPPEMGDGPFYLFYRPYHLCHIEAMSTVAEAFLDRRALLQPTYGFQTNVYAYAKRDLGEGETLDGIGGYTCYGLIENCEANEGRSGLPICLAENVTLKTDIAKDEKILLSKVGYDPHRIDFQLYAKAVEQSKSSRETL